MRKPFKIYDINDSGAAIAVARTGETWKIRGDLNIGDVIMATKTGMFSWNWYDLGYHNAERVPHQAPKSVLAEIWCDN